MKRKGERKKIWNIHWQLKDFKFKKETWNLAVGYELPVPEIAGIVDELTELCLYAIYE